MICVAPQLREQLSQLPAGSRPEDPLLLEHLRACEVCSAELEQRRRWFAAWDRSEPDAAAGARLRARLQRPTAARRSPRLIVAVAAAGLLLASIAGATGYLWKRGAGHTEVAPQEAASKNAVTDMRKRQAPTIAEPPATAVPSSTESMAAPAMVSESAQPASKPKLASSAQIAETWSEAATALRTGDTKRAEKALSELGRSRDAATRDAAQLAQAELWLSHGRAAQARQTLQGLAQSGATPLIRKRARELLDR